ncbi:MAG: EamA family transporter [Clostridia bacterium]|nr:EamA family transporter [Clostridia bacterium]
MHYLLLAILCSAAMSIVLKRFKDPAGNRYGVILGNYFTCVVIALAAMPSPAQIVSGSGVTYLCGAVSGVLFVVSLLAMQNCIRANGASLTAAFSRLGLLVPLTVSIAFLGEQPTLWDCAGLVLVLGALFFISGGAKEGGAGEKPRTALLLMTLLASGFSDVMAKLFERVGSRGEDRLYFFCLFATAALLTSLLTLRERRRSGKHLLPAELAMGILVGLPNYFSSFLLLRSLISLPAFLVYPLFSTGTILAVIAFSVPVFHERLTRRQVVGIVMILIALALLNI